MTAITYRNAGAWGPGVGRILTSAEVDTNFYNLDQGKADKQSTGKVSAVQAPNLLFNSTGEVGNVGWGSSNFASANDVNSAGGYWFTNTVAIAAGVSFDDASSLIPVSAGQTLNISGEISTAGASQGQAYLKVDFYDNTQALIGTGSFSTTALPFNTAFTYKTATGTAPAGAVYAKVHKIADSSPLSVAAGIRFRRIKLEYGTGPSAYSQEATIANTLCKSNNLSDVADPAASAHNLGLGAADTPTFTGIKLSGSTTHAVPITQAGAGLTYATIGTAGRVLVDNGAGADPSFQSIGVLSGKNRIINGMGLVAQRGSSQAFANNTSGYGGPDRFFAYNTGGGGQFTQSTSTITYGGRALAAIKENVDSAITSMTGTDIWSGIDQKIEGYNAFDLLGQTAVCSFVFYSNVAGTYSFNLRDGDASNSFSTTFTVAANTPTKVVIPIPSLPTTLSIPNSSNPGLEMNIGALNTGTYQCPTASLGAWVAGNYISAQGATNWGTAINNFISATQIQLEAGSVATPFEFRQIAQELKNCESYFQSRGVLASTNSADATNQAWVTLPTVMRASPTITLTNNTIGCTYVAMGRDAIRCSGNGTAFGQAIANCSAEL